MQWLYLYIAMPWTSLRMHRESIHGTRECSPGGTICGKGGPPMAPKMVRGTICGSRTWSTTKTFRRWSGGTDFGGNIHGMTGLTVETMQRLFQRVIHLCACSVRYAYFVPYAYGTSYTRMGYPICVRDGLAIPYAYGCPICVWY